MPVLSAVSKVALMERLEKNKVQFSVNSKILKFYADGVQYERNGMVEEVRGYDTVVLALGSKDYPDRSRQKYIPSYSNTAAALPSLLCLEDMPQRQIVLRYVFLFHIQRIFFQERDLLVKKF